MAYNSAYTGAHIEKKLAPIKQKTVTVAATAWAASTDPAGFTATVGDTDIIDGCRLEAWPVIASQDAAGAAEIYADLACAVGSFTLAAKARPTASITFKYTIQI
jgi:hypothetical protein